MSSLNHDREMTISSFRVFVAVCVMLSQAEPGNAQSDRDDAARGKATFLRVGCYQCHGREAQGASTGPRLGPNPPPMAAFTRAVRTPRNEMPPYGSTILSDAELADIYAFVVARPRPHEL